MIRTGSARKKRTSTKASAKSKIASSTTTASTSDSTFIIKRVSVSSIGFSSYATRVELIIVFGLALGYHITNASSYALMVPYRPTPDYDPTICDSKKRNKASRNSFC